MTANTRSRVSWFGIVIIFIGVLLLVDRLHLLRVDSQIILWCGLMLLGLLMVVRGFSSGRSGKIFWGSFLFLLFLFFLLRSTDMMDIHAHMMPPAIFLILGISFFMVFLNAPKEWSVLIPAVSFPGLGTMLIMVEYGILYEWDVWDIIRTYWPLILILFGLSIVLRHRSRKQSSEAVPQ